VVDDGFFLSAEFIRWKIAGHGHCRAEIFRSGRSPTLQSLAKLEGASPDAPKIFRQCGSTALQKTIRYSLLATRCRFGWSRWLRKRSLLFGLRVAGWEL